MNDIENRLRRLEDRSELQDLIVRYFLAADDNDYEALAATFAPDAAFSAGGFTGGRSRAEIVEFIRADRTNSMGVTIHTPNFVLLEFPGVDAATGVIGAHLELSRSGRTLYGAVRYRDEYVRLDGRWYIKKREMLTIHMGPWEDVATSLTAERRVRWPDARPAHADLPLWRK